jgi:hypothetical protein
MNRMLPALLFGLSACQIPLPIGLPTEPDLQGTFVFPPTTLRTQTITADKTTITLSYPPGHPQAKQPILSGLANSEGHFMLQWPDQNIPPQGEIFLLQAAKRAGRTGKDMLTLSTYVRRSANGWESITGNTLRLDPLTTALVTLDTHREELTAIDLLSAVQTIGQAPTLAGVPASMVTQIHGLTRWLLEQQQDPQHFVGYASGTFFPIRPPALTLEALRATGKCPGCDLSHLDLRNETVSGVDLRGADLTYSNLAGVTLQGSQIEEARFDGANLGLARWFNGFYCEERSVGNCYYEFRPSPSTGQNWVPDVAQDPKGLTWVVWSEHPHVYGRIYAPLGNALTAPFQLDEGEVELSHPPSLTYSPSGVFIVSWEQATPRHFKGRIYNPDGSLQGATFMISNSTYNKNALSLAADAQGRFVAVWESVDQDGDAQGIFMRRFNQEGVALDDTEIQVNTNTQRSQLNPAVAMSPDGRFVISWYSNPTNNNPHIAARTYAADGTPLSGEIQIYAGQSAQSKVQMDSTGNFVVAWQNSTSLFIQRFAIDGTPLSEVYRVGDFANGSSRALDMAMDIHGRIVIAWHGPPLVTGDYYDVMIQRISPQLTPVGTSQRMVDFGRHEAAIETALADTGQIIVSYHVSPLSGGNLAATVKRMHF